MYLLPAIASAVMGVAAYLVYQLLHLITHTASVSCIVAIVVGAGIYFIIMLLIHGITREDMGRFPGGTYLIRIAEKMRLL